MQDHYTLDRHIRHCAKLDCNFRQNWGHVHRRCESILATISAFTLPLASFAGSDWAMLHTSSMHLANAMLTSIPNVDFSIVPNMDRWLKWTCPQN